MWRCTSLVRQAGLPYPLCSRVHAKGQAVGRGTARPRRQRSGPACSPRATKDGVATRGSTMAVRSSWTTARTSCVARPSRCWTWPQAQQPNRSKERTSERIACTRVTALPFLWRQTNNCPRGYQALSPPELQATRKRHRYAPLHPLEWTADVRNFVRRSRPRQRYNRVEST